MKSGALPRGRRFFSSAGLSATLATHSAGELLAPIRAALADFDLVLAQQRVDAVIAVLGADPITEPNA